MTDLSSVPTDELLAMYERSKLPRGLRNNNPGNIEDGAFARGLPGYQGSDGRFAVFDSMENGQAAKGALLQSYGRRGFNTVEKVIGRWAPPSENDTGSYVQFVSQRLGVDPRQPLDLDNPQTLSELQAAIAERENGPQAAPARDVASMSTDELLALYKGDAAAGGGPVPVPQLGPGVTAELDRPAPARPTGPRQSDTLAFVVGAIEPYQRTRDRVPNLREGLDIMANFGSPLGILSRGADSIMAKVGEQAQKGVVPKRGGAAEFAGNVAATLPTWMIPGVVAPSAIGGFLTSKADDAKGLAFDTVVAGGFGKLGDEVARAVAPRIGALLSKKPDAAIRMGRDGRLTSPLLEEATKIKSDLYAAVENSGFVFNAKDVAKVAADFAADVRARGGPKGAQLIPAADAFAARFKELAAQPGGVSLTQLDKLRSQIFDDLIEKGGTEANMGYVARSMIDDLMDRAGAPLIREARRANTAYEKMSDVVRRVASGRLAAGRANSGQNVVNAARSKLSPTIDPLHTAQVRNYTPDERMQVDRIVTGDKISNGLRETSNLARNKFVSTGLALLTGTGTANPLLGLGAFAGLEGLGQALRRGAERYTRGQIDDLLRMMAAGGSKAAASRARVPTVAGRTAQAAVTAAPIVAPVVATQATAAERKKRAVAPTAPQPRR